MSSGPRDDNRVPSLIAKSDADNTPVIVEADPTTKRLKVNATITGGGVSGTQYTDGDVPPAHPTGNALEWNDGSVWQTVSTAKPLPVTASISTAGLATSTKQSDGSQKTQVVDGSGNVIGATSNALDVNVKSGSISRVNNQQISDADIATTADGVQLMSIAGPTGDPIDTTGSSLNTVVTNNVKLDSSSTVNIAKTLGTNLPFDTTDYVATRGLPPQTWRSGFSPVIATGTDTFTRVVATGSGQAISQASGSLVITTGTTANAESVVRSNTSFKGDFVARAAVKLSQRIVNQNFIVELVDVIGDSLPMTINSTTSVTVNIPNNPFTSTSIGQSMYIGVLTGAANTIPGRYAIASVAGSAVTFTVSGWPASGSGFCSLFGWNYHHMIYDGTIDASAKYDAQREGWATGDSTITINPPSQTHVWSLGSTAGTVSLSDQTGQPSTTIELVERTSRVRNVPVNETVLYFQVRVVNGTTAPTSSTTLTMGFLELDQYINQSVVINSVTPQSLNNPLPVQIRDIPNVSLSLGGRTPSVSAAGALLVDNSMVTTIDNIGQIDGNQIATVGDGTQLVGLAGPTGDPINTIGNALEVATTRNLPASDETSTIFNGAVPLSPQFASIAVSSSGVNIVIAAMVGKAIRVLSYVLTANGTVNVKWQSHTLPTDLTGLDYLVANTGVSSGYSPIGHFQSRVGESLDINLSGAIAVGGHLTYILV